MKPIKVLLVDDHEMVRIGLSAMLATEEDVEIVGEAASGEEALALAEAFRPDVVLMDLVMAGMDGIETTRRLVRLLPDCKVIVLTSYVDDEKVYPAMEAGAFGYLLKTSRAADITRAIRNAAEGRPTLEPQVATKMISRFRRFGETPPHEELTEREREVLRLVAKGKSNRDIAEELGIGIKTVKFHLSNIFAKLGVEDRTQAVVYAFRHGLVDE
ncbi:MAG: DNA-binding response regulator [Candidatus Reconcilbacillus cellulovorans]|uniref:DNA-binding response regulator n=1 Tax=Candidatus Reconcilbacillus cellulovorans TaxID=1906605 RepID=A0A2A6DY54_9BACL|nr:MAG: DNA-binding response regulator [Candidatus Reconcilbacillus cellulovorans]